MSDQPSTSEIRIWVDDEPLVAPAATSLAAVMALHGITVVFCGMGSCHECVLTVDGKPGVRACLTAARPGMDITTRPAIRLEDR